MQQNRDSDFSVVRDIIGTCYIPFLACVTLYSLFFCFCFVCLFVCLCVCLVFFCDTVTKYFGICNKIVIVIFPSCVTL